MAHFLDRFDSNTDVLYGMGKWIHYYLYNYYFIWKGYLDPEEIPAYTPEEMSSDKFGKAHDAYQKNVINNYNSGLTKIDMSIKGKGTPTATMRVKPPRKPPADPIFAHYLDALTKSRGMGPSTLAGSISDLAPAFDEYEGASASLGATGDDKARKKIYSTAFDIAIRRSCMFGIEYFSKFGTVHYILDELDIEKVVNRTMVTNETTGDKKVPICTSELWYLFYHWADLKRDRKVVFWENFEEVAPPWESGKWSSTHTKWAASAVARYEDRAHRVPAPIKGLFSGALSAAKSAPSDPATATTTIKAFHRVPSAFLTYPQETAESPRNGPEGGWNLVAAARPADAPGTPGLDG